MKTSVITPKRKGIKFYIDIIYCLPLMILISLEADRERPRPHLLTYLEFFNHYKRDLIDIKNDEVFGGKLAHIDFIRYVKAVHLFFIDRALYYEEEVPYDVISKYNENPLIKARLASKNGLPVYF